MDKQGNIFTGTEKEFLRSFSEKDLEKDEAEAPRKISLSEYMSSPEFQRKQKIASERAQQREYEQRWRFVQLSNRIRSRVDRDANVGGSGGDCLNCKMAISGRQSAVGREESRAQLAPTEEKVHKRRESEWATTRDSFPYKGG